VSSATRRVAVICGQLVIALMDGELDPAQRIFRQDLGD